MIKGAPIGGTPINLLIEKIMIEFKPLGKAVEKLKPFLEGSPVSFCDISLGAKYIWRDEFIIDYAVVDDTLILKESCKDYENAFYFPMGKNPEAALSAIEEYAINKGVPLLFCCIDNNYAAFFSKRYPFAEVYNDRNWSDYIYEAERFKTYSGKKMSGQRNHVNKFKRSYPDYSFKQIEKADLPMIKEFITEFERGEDFSMWTKVEENKKLWDYIENFERLGQLGGMLVVENKVVAISLGEIVGDTLIVHVEKGLKSYDGVYPTMASEFAKRFAESGVKFINREEDCGDMGLRVSKLQYHPLEVKEKNFVRVKTLFDKITPPVLLKTERLEITDIFDTDKKEYYRLYTDDKLNALYGYDYREDFKGDTPTPEYFMEFMRGLKEKREEYSVAVKLNNKMIGEIVVYTFGYFGEAEIGFRFFKEYHGKGYAQESVLAMIEYLKVKKAQKIKARCFKQNAPSIRLLEKLGFIKTTETETQYFFEAGY